MNTSYLFLAQGFEEIEALTGVDVLRRAGMPLKTVSITTSLQVTGAHGITVNADLIYTNTLFKNPEWLVLPGGMPGASNLAAYGPLMGLLDQQLRSQDGHIAAICAAPAVVLGANGLLKGRMATCYPGFENMLEGAEHVNAPVVSDNKFVLGNGPANALPWALEIVRQACGDSVAQEVGSGMLYYPAPDNNVVNYFG